MSLKQEEKTTTTTTTTTGTTTKRRNVFRNQSKKDVAEWKSKTFPIPSLRKLKGNEPQNLDTSFPMVSPISFSEGSTIFNTTATIGSVICIRCMEPILTMEDCLSYLHPVLLRVQCFHCKCFN